MELGATCCMCALLKQIKWRGGFSSHCKPHWDDGDTCRTGQNPSVTSLLGIPTLSLELIHWTWELWRWHWMSPDSILNVRIIHVVRIGNNYSPPPTPPLEHTDWRAALQWEQTVGWFRSLLVMQNEPFYQSYYFSATRAQWIPTTYILNLSCSYSCRRDSHAAVNNLWFTSVIFLPSTGKVM